MGFILKDINGNKVEIPRDEIVNIVNKLRLESPNYLETFDDFLNWIKVDYEYYHESKSLPNGTDMLSLPFVYYSQEKAIENEIKNINQIIIESVIHGADSGGSYDSNENNLINSINNWLELKDLKGKYEVKEVEVHIRKRLWFIHQIVKKIK